MGIHHHGSDDAGIGIVIVVGGRQYRVGAHRQYVLLARELAAAGVPVLRFDVRGMGDSSGDARDFLELADDIRAAVDAFSQLCPAVRRIGLWGLCDGATASILYALGDSRVAGVMLVNPWVTTDAGQARSYLRHYYLRRLKDPGFWRKLRRGQFQLRASSESVVGMIKEAFRSLITRIERAPTLQSSSLPDRVFDVLDIYCGSVSVVISDDDMTAREFEDAWRSRQRRRSGGQTAELVLARIAADHTFSEPEGQRKLFDLTLAWTQTLGARK